MYYQGFTILLLFLDTAIIVEIVMNVNVVVSVNFVNFFSTAIPVIKYR